ncbi:type II secretion system protein [uncultured Ruminococcus sp.]|uniref:type II secretion system protein n=1 Tax=Ruminococcus sp. TaxID=41978 RepID=UPI0015B4D554|nr:type II secretion system protein [uncultured Ruminococcus sp.]
MKNKKNSKGMTLVEVVIAMTIFAMVAGAVMTAISGAVQQTAKNRKRDLEVGQQANAVRKYSNAEVTDLGKYTLSFDDSRGETKEVQMYEADAAQFGTDFGFQVKSFNVGGFTATATENTSTAEYKVSLINQTNENITAYVTVDNGFLYTGKSSATGYIHTSPLYVTTIQAKSDTGIDGKAEFGFCLTAAAFSNGDVKIRFVTDSNVTYGEFSLSAADFDSSRTKTFTYSSSGVNG